MSKKIIKASNIELAGQVLSVVDRAKKALGLADLEQTLFGIASASKHLIDITNADGLKQVYTARVMLKNERCRIQKAGKDARDDANKFTKAVIAEESRLISIIEPEEKRLEKLQSIFDDEQERQRQERINAELRRVAEIKERIDTIRALVTGCSHLLPAKIQDTVDNLEKIQIDDSFAEFSAQATDAKIATLSRLRELHTSALQREQEARRIVAEREELARLRAAEEQRQAAERARIAEEQRQVQECLAEAQRIAAEERQRQEAARRAEEAKLEAQRKTQEIEARRLADEQRRLDSERAEIERKKDVAFVPPELVPDSGCFIIEVPSAENVSKIVTAEERHSLLEKVASEMPSLEEIISVLATHFGVGNETVIDWFAKFGFDVSEELAEYPF